MSSGHSFAQARASGLTREEPSVYPEGNSVSIVAVGPYEQAELKNYEQTALIAVASV
jgi:hypothetical protein